MQRLVICLLGGLIALLSFSAAFADETAAVEGIAVTADEQSATDANGVLEEEPAQAAEPVQNAYGFNVDDIAVNQGVVAYWYAHGFANAFGSLPAKWAEVEARKILLRNFKSPHSGEDIDFDDGALDFDGDMTYSQSGWDAQIQVQTTAGVVTLPGTLQGGWNCPQRSCNSCNPCGKCVNRSLRCCDVTICGWDCWGISCADDVVCKIIQWMMWKSFETYECRYGCRPADELMWIASGIAPVDKNWKELAPQMSIEYIYDKCVLKKAKVHCCRPCVAKCGSCGDCGHQAKSCGGCNKPSCGQCKSKCNSGSKCGVKDCGGMCGKPASGCSNCGKSGCNKCKTKSGCNSCGKPDCNKCQAKSGCGNCGKSGCDKCHAKTGCNSCGKSSCKGNCGRSNCDSCQKVSSGCDRCGGRGCNRCDREDDGGTWVD